MTTRPIERKAVTQRDVAKGAGTALMSRLGGVIEVVAQPAYTWMFGLATYGLYTVLWSLVNLVENIADLGMTSALQRVVPQAETEEEAVLALRSALLMGLTPCLVIAAVASICAPWLAQVINVAADDRARLATGIALFAWALPLWALVEINTSALRARRAFGPEIRLRIFWEQLIRLAIATLLWAGGIDTLGLLVAHLVSLSITAGLSVRLLSRHYDMRLLMASRIVSPMFFKTWWAGIAVLPSNIIGRMFSDAPPVILNLWFPGAQGAMAAGLYGIARKLASLVQLIRMTFSYVMGPLASAVAHHDREVVRSLYGFSTRLSIALAFPLAAALIGSGRDILTLFGPGAQAAWPLLVALTVARVVDAVGGPAGAIQQVISHQSRNAISSVSGLVIALALMPFLLTHFQMTGMAMAVGFGMASSSIITIIQLYRHDHIHPFSPAFFRTLAAGCLVSAAMVVLLVNLHASAPIEIVATVATALAAVLLMYRFGLGQEDRLALGRPRRPRQQS